MNTRLVYLTAPDADEARRLARTMVEERLAACANLLGGIESVYWWEGSLESGSEQAVILKTTADRVEALVRRITELHSYDCPCVVALPIEGGNPGFLEWIHAETRTGG